MPKKTLTLKKKITKSDTTKESNPLTMDTEKKTAKSTLSLGGGRRKKLSLTRTKTKSVAKHQADGGAEEGNATSVSNTLQAPSRKRRNKRVVVNPNAKRRKKPVKKVAKKKVVKQPPKKKKKKEPPKKQRRPVRVEIVRPTPPADIAAKELDARLTERYSVWRDFKPLEVGIDTAVLELITREKWEYSKRVMRKAFKLHVRDMRYRETLVKGGKRYNLDNEAVEDVHEFSMAYAQIYVDRRAARIIREKKVVEEMENLIAADRLKAQEAKSNRLSLSSK